MKVKFNKKALKKIGKRLLTGNSGRDTKKGEFENPEFENPDFYNPDFETADESMEENPTEDELDLDDSDFEQELDDESTQKPETKKEKNKKTIKISKKRVKRIGKFAVFVFLVYIISKIFGPKAVEEEDVIYKWGQTNNRETIELKQGIEIEPETSIIQRRKGEEINTYIVTEENGIIDITKFKSKDLDITFFQSGIVEANEARVELMPMDGKSNSFYTNVLHEGTELIVYPNLVGDNMRHVRDLKTGEEGLLPEVFINIDGDKEFNVSGEEESNLHIVGFKGRVPLTETMYKYSTPNELENCIGYMGELGKMNFTLVTPDDGNPEYYHLLDYIDKDIFVNYTDVYDLYKIEEDGIEETRNADIIFYDNSETKIEKNKFVFGVISNEAEVGGGLFSKKTDIKPNSLYFEFTDAAFAIVDGKAVRITSSAKKGLDINYVQKGTAFGNGQSVDIKDKDGNKKDGKKIIDWTETTTLPEPSITTDEGTLIPVYGDRTRTRGYVWESEMPNLDLKQFDISDEEPIFFIRAEQDVAIRSSRQNSEIYTDNIIAYLLTGEEFMVKATDKNTYVVIDPRYPEYNGGIISISERTTPTFQITSEGINEIELPKQQTSKAQYFRTEQKADVVITYSGSGDDGNNSIAGIKKVTNNKGRGAL